MATASPRHPDVPVADLQIPLDATRTLAARVHGRAPAGGGPLVLHFHAGAFVGGDVSAGATVAGMLARAGAVVLSIDYPLAPAHPFPEALEAGHGALLWAWRQRRRLAGAGATLWVAGEEAGGNLAASLALMSRDRHQPALAGQILLSPMLDTCVATASLRRAQAGPVGCRWADGWHDYLSRPDDALHPYAAPGSATRLGELPPTLLVTAQDDPMRDEALGYAARLRAVHVDVTLVDLAVATGWPCSWMHGDAAAPPAWVDMVGAHVGDFYGLHARAAR